MVSREEFDALRAAHEELREDFRQLRKEHDELADAYSAFCEQNRTQSMAVEDSVIAIVRAARAVTDGFPDNFDAVLITLLREKEGFELRSSEYFQEIARLANAFGCSDGVRPKSREA
jgi:hypothetical protein